MAGGGTEGAMASVQEVATKLESNYRENTPQRLRVLDMFLAFVFVTGVLQVIISYLFLPPSIYLLFISLVAE